MCIRDRTDKVREDPSTWDLRLLMLLEESSDGCEIPRGRSAAVQPVASDVSLCVHLHITICIIVLFVVVPKCVSHFPLRCTSVKNFGKIIGGAVRPLSLIHI